VSGNSVTILQRVDADGGDSVTKRGICWSTNPLPTIEKSNILLNGSGIGNLNTVVTGLNTNTKYFFRGFATNSAGTVYSSEITVTTPSYQVKVGDKYAGGLITWLIQPGYQGYDPLVPHGLITMPNDLYGSATMTGNTYITGRGYGDGYSNCYNVMFFNLIEGVTMKDLFLNKNINGYRDWFIPSLQELQFMLMNKDIIGGYNTGPYWTSSSCQQQNYLGIHLSGGTCTKLGGKAGVRLARYF
jgi:hypothetical protein